MKKELIFCEKCVTCKYLSYENGNCLNANKMDWVDKDCKDHKKV